MAECKLLCNAKVKCMHMHTLTDWLIMWRVAKEMLPERAKGCIFYNSNRYLKLLELTVSLHSFVIWNCYMGKPLLVAMASTRHFQ